MSGGLYAEPGIIKKGHYDQDDKEENIVDIYVSAESLRVYDHPWVESMAPNIPTETQHPVVSENSGKRNRMRTDSVFLGALCLFLLAGIIFVGVKMGKWRRETHQLLAVNTGLRKINAQLKFNNTRLSKERDALRRTICENKPEKCKKDWSTNP